MSRALGAKRAAATQANAAQRHCTDLERTAANIEKLIEILAPTRKPADIVKLFDGRTTYGTIQQWRHGRRHVPSWAREIIRTTGARILQLESDLPTGPGTQAGWRNVAGYAANRAS